MFSAYVVVYILYRLLYLNLKLSSAQLPHISIIRRVFSTVIYLLEPKGGGEDGRSVGLFYYFILS